MELCYYKGKNFGDELNPYIINILLPNYKEIYENYSLFFIGTILNDSFIQKTQGNDIEKYKIILGAGVRFIKRPPKVDKYWKIVFVRGPLSALSLTKDTKDYITDPAYLIKYTPAYNFCSRGKKYKVSLMPHIFSLDKINWKKLCANHGINFIDPSCKNVEYVVQEIAQSEYLISEAMHGAIIADAFRVPWKRIKYFSHFKESDLVSEYKWADWLFSMKLTHFTCDLHYNKFIREIDKRYNISYIKNLRLRYAEDNFKEVLKDDGYQLSNAKILEDKTEQLLQKVNLISNCKI